MRVCPAARTFTFFDAIFKACSNALLRSGSGKFRAGGTVYRDSSLSDYRLGTPVGQIELDASKVAVLMNRNLASLMNPLAVARDVLGR